MTELAPHPRHGNTLVRKTPAAPEAEMGDIPPPPDDPVEDISEEELKSSYHARVVHSYQTDPGFRKRTPVAAYARERSRFLEQRSKRQQHSRYAEANKARFVPKPDAHPHPLRPSLMPPFKFFHLLSDVPKEVLLSPGYLKLSVQDSHGERIEPDDKVRVGDRLVVWEPMTKRLRFRARADVIDTASRSIDWEEEIGGIAE